MVLYAVCRDMHTPKPDEIQDSNGWDYEDGSILVFDAVWSGTSVPKFQSIMFFPSSELMVMEATGSPETSAHRKKTAIFTKIQGVILGTPDCTSLAVF